MLVEATNGKLLAWAGGGGSPDPAAVASLLTQGFKVAGGLRKLVDDEEIHYESTDASDSFYIGLLLKRLLLVVVFDERTSLKRVRPRARNAGTEIATGWPAI